MCDCDARSSNKKNPNMFDNHPNLQLRMRAILLDWLNEVSQIIVCIHHLCPNDIT